MVPELAVDQRVFPAAPPADLTNARVITEHDWRAFSSVGRMTDHWARPGWDLGRRSYYWMLTFPQSPRLLGRVRHCRSALEHLGMDPVPDDGLHITVARIGGADEVTPADLRRLVRLVSAMPLSAFQVFAHPLAGSRGAIRFSLAPWTPLIRLHAALTTGARSTPVPGGKPTASYRPHLGLAYNNIDRPAAPVIDAVEPLRSLPPVPLDVTHVALVELRREGPTYQWNTLRSVPLGTK
ncbi:2'-5' RNA ligase family protein [Streptomyces sp. NPDC057654]|uniref:2'-5' RNA ligase family protein n=1 Tax=Streptomyces sp. NPDC057654 TaxID=3346196 RepID=UPI0036A8745B